MGLTDMSALELVRRLAMCVLGAAISGCAASPKQEISVAGNNEEKAIFQAIDAFSAAWSRGDAKAAASFYTEDGVRVGASGDLQRGRAELEAAYERLLRGPFEGATVTQQRGTVRMLAPDLALWQGGIEINTPSGPAIKGYVVQVMKKVGDRWLVLEGHPKLYPPATR